VESLVAVLGELRRVLRGDGTLWLNLGDSYNAAGRNGHGTRIGYKQQTNRASANGSDANRPTDPDLKEKDLVGIPWRVAFALQADGWYLRSDIIWSKPNPMPESVTDRPTKAHEYVFLLSKQPRYYYDADAISEPATWYGPNGRGPSSGPHGEQMSGRRGRNPSWDERKAAGATRGNLAFADNVGTGTHRGVHGNGVSHNLGDGLTRNKRSVWEVQTVQYADAHFATFPPSLIEPCILAGCPPDGTVLDPFAGSGTTGLVARKHGRNSVLIELNADYCQLAATRLQQLSLLAGPAA
jgi:DNA modification methylase